jgi:hypothetical protein
MREISQIRTTFPVIACKRIFNFPIVFWLSKSKPDDAANRLSCNTNHLAGKHVRIGFSGQNLVSLPVRGPNLDVTRVILRIPGRILQKAQLR